MTPFILYQLKTGLCLALFIGLYYLLFRKETFHTANRIYLVSSMILSACIPFIKLPSFATGSDDQVLAVVNPIIIQGIVTNAPDKSESLPWLSIVYITLIAGFSLFIAYQLIRLLSLIWLKECIIIEGCRVYFLPEKKQSFSFFNLIIVSSDDAQILQHEIAHARQLHSLDIILVQILKIFQWFNPFIYLTEKAIQETHEYLADKAAMEHDGGSNRYRMLLVTRAFGVQSGIFNFFNYSLLKNRLIMITKERSIRWHYLKYLSSVPLLVIALLLLGAPVISQTPVSTSATEEEKMQVQKPQDNVQEPAYVFVDEQAAFQGGSIETFREWIQKQLIYPPEAIANKIQGRLTMQFAVNSAGKVCEIKILRGVDPLLDNEAMRVVGSSPDWTPAKVGGKSVKQQFVFPIIFNLSEKSTAGDNPPPPPPPPPPAGLPSKLTFQGSSGSAAIMKFLEWLQDEVVYPSEAVSQGIQGKVEFMFTILPTGKMGEVKISKGVHPLLDEEILRAVRSSPDWEPFPKGDDKPRKHILTFIFELS